MFNKFREVSIDENNYFNIILGDVKEKIMNNLILNIRNYEDMGTEIIVFLFYWFLFSFLLDHISTLNLHDPKKIALYMELK